MDRCKSVIRVNLDYEFLSNLESMEFSGFTAIFSPSKFSKLKNLKKLVIENLKCDEFFHQDMFSGLQQLEKLQISHLRKRDQFSLYIESKILFQNLSNLTELTCNSVLLLKFIPDEMFSGTTNLKKIDLSNNSIKEIGKEAFDGLKNLKSLNLSQNWIENLENGVFKNFKSLDFLYLGYNPIKVLDPEIMKRITIFEKFTFEVKSIMASNKFLVHF